jgi:FkbM family methyltransferase
MLSLLRVTKSHLFTIYWSILKEPLNRGRRLHYLQNYLLWNLRYKYAGQRWVIKFENGYRSYVYPFPDHDAGELNIQTRNVDYFDIEFIRKHIRTGDFIVDAGCNVGNRTLAIADLIGGALLIDAGEVAIKRSLENLLLNGLSPENYFLVKKAVGDTTGTVFFSDFGGANTVNRVISEKENNAVKTYPVEMTTIDQELSAINRSPSFIKTDLEGHDLLALQGAVNTLRSGTVRLVKFEHNQSEPLEPLLEFFEALSWKVFALDRRGKPTDQEAYIGRNMNLFAAPRPYYEEVILKALDPEGGES